MANLKASSYTAEKLKFNTAAQICCIKLKLRKLETDWTPVSELFKGMLLLGFTGLVISFQLGTTP